MNRIFTLIFGLSLGVAASACDTDESTPATCGTWLSCYESCIALPQDPFDLGTISTDTTIATCSQACRDETGWESGFVEGYCVNFFWRDDYPLPDAEPVAIIDITHNHALAREREACRYDEGGDPYSDGCRVMRDDAIYIGMTVRWCRAQCAQEQG